jgi:hypothetical protein
MQVSDDCPIMLEDNFMGPNLDFLHFTSAQSKKQNNTSPANGARWQRSSSALLPSEIVVPPSDEYRILVGAEKVWSR